MKIHLLIILILLGFSGVLAQKVELKADTQISDSVNYREKAFLPENSGDVSGLREVEPSARDLSKKLPQIIENFEETSVAKFTLPRSMPFRDIEQAIGGEKEFDGSVSINPHDDSDGEVDSRVSEKFHWTPAIKQSILFLGIQHGFRLFQKKTQRGLDGKFFSDWGHTVKNLRGWRDGDNFITNYVGHPMQGGLTGRIFINNSDKSKKLEFGSSKDYWKSRFKAFVWSAVWSAQFELGPISEGSIGNVGIDDDRGPSKMAWVDLVVTPSAGTGVLIGEDIIDKFILKKWLEKKITSRTRVKVYRTFFTPLSSFANILGGKVPWHRANR